MTEGAHTNRPSITGHKQKRAVRYAWLISLGVLVLASLSARTVDLGADPPSSWLPKDIGYHIDEGYKTLDPRNLLVFGQRKWNEADEYSGWMDASPVTQWSYYLSFKWLGLDRTSVRLVNVAFFALLLVGATLFFLQRYSAVGVLLGTALLGADVALFQFSRVATFEIAVCLFVYLVIVSVAVLWEKERRISALLFALGGGVAGTFGVKLSVLLYLIPALGALGVNALFDRVQGRNRSERRFNLGIALLVLGIAVMLYVTRSVWMGRLDFGSLVSDPYRLIFNPLHRLSPLAFSLAYLALTDLVLREGFAGFRKSALLAMSSAVAILTPLTLALFPHNPPRYYVAVVPAALLIIVEWIHLNRTGRPRNEYRLSPATVAVTLPLLLLLSGTLTQFGDHYILPYLEFVPQGEAPGLARSSLESAFFLMAGAGLLGAGFLFARRKLKPSVVGATKVGVGVHLVASLLIIAITLQNTTYVTGDIQSEITRRIDAGATVGGDWAPYFLLDTHVPVVYVTHPDQSHNTSDNMERLRLDYFLSSSTGGDKINLEGLRNNPRIRIASKTRVGKIFGNKIILYGLEY